MVEKNFWRLQIFELLTLRIPIISIYFGAMIFQDNSGIVFAGNL